MTTPLLTHNLFRPGQRIAVAVSGGADSVALLRRLLEERQQLGIVLSVVHVHHGMRQAAADEDATFVANLAQMNDLPFYLQRVDAPAAATALHETLEEAARNLRYSFFQELMEKGLVDAVATAHTADDQAETVLYKLLRGAWTEGLSGIHPVVITGPGTILRPFLGNSRATIEAWLRSLSQPWCEDSTNQDLAHTRNRIRHQLLPLLSTYNPQIARQLARVASIAADEEAYWQGELQRLMPALLLPGRPTRGGGRSASTHPEQEAVAIEAIRLKQLHPAVARRVLRAAARRLGARLSFEHTEQLLALAGAETRAKSKFDLPGGITVERSLREIRMAKGVPEVPAGPEVEFPVPGEVRAPEYNIHLRVECPGMQHGQAKFATLRTWKPGDRVTVRFSRGPKKVAEVLDRLHVLGAARKNWPVIELEGAIIWMQGVSVEAPELLFTPVT